MIHKITGLPWLSKCPWTKHEWFFMWGNLEFQFRYTMQICDSYCVGRHKLRFLYYVGILQSFIDSHKP